MVLLHKQTRCSPRRLLDKCKRRFEMSWRVQIRREAAVHHKSSPFSELSLSVNTVRLKPPQNGFLWAVWKVGKESMWRQQPLLPNGWSPWCCPRWVLAELRDFPDGKQKLSVALLFGSQFRQSQAWPGGFPNTHKVLDSGCQFLTP